MRYRWFESVSLQRGVSCEPDFIKSTGDGMLRFRPRLRRNGDRDARRRLLSALSPSCHVYFAGWVLAAFYDAGIIQNPPEIGT